MNAMLRLLDGFLKRVLVALMAAIVLVVCWQVFSRFVLDSPSSMTEEIARCLLLWIGMLGAAFAYRTGQHLGLDIVVRKFSPQTQQGIAMLLTVLVVLFALAVMVLGGGALVQLTLELKQMSASLGIPVGWIYSVIPLAGGLIAFYGLCQLRSLWHGEPLPQPEGID